VQIKQLIRKYAPEYLHTYNSYDHWVMQVDFSKYILAYLFGHGNGAFIVDMDTIPTGKDFHELAKFADGHVLWESVTDQNSMLLWPEMDFVNNHFMYTPRPRHPFFKYLLDQAVIEQKRKVWHVKPYYILSCIGPFFVMKHIERWNDKLVDTVTLVDSKPIRKYFSHESHISWLRHDSFDGNDVAALAWIGSLGYIAYKGIKQLLTSR
jgi:mannosyltransferase OCH1-like enzyme